MTTSNRGHDPKQQQQSQSLLSTFDSNDNNDNRNQKTNYASIYDHLNSEEDSDDASISIDTVTLPVLHITCILSTAFAYGCIMTTLFIIILPLECERLHHDHPNIPKSVALGVFVALAGWTQLISPLVGRLSDTYVPPVPHELGQRLPYLVLGAMITCSGLLGQAFASHYGFWMRYSFAFFLHMLGLNVVYSMMVALIPDQVPSHQTGVANGILALLLVTGSLFGFALFHWMFDAQIQSMYELYIGIVIVAAILTGTHAHERDAQITYQRIRRRSSRMLIQRNREKNNHKNKDDYNEDDELLCLSPRHSSNASSITFTKDGTPQWQRVAGKVAKRVVKNAAKTAQNIVLTPTLILKTMLVDPVSALDWQTFCRSYRIDTVKHPDFFMVTVSRLFYYCGISVQTFFLYFVHDRVGVHHHPEKVVATMAILGQCTGALTCYPVGVISDTCCRGRRKPFVYIACAILSITTLSMIIVDTLQTIKIMSLILGAANGIYLTMDTSLAVDTLPSADDENSDETAQLLGIWGVAAFLGSAIGPMINGPLLYIFGEPKGGYTDDLVDDGDTEDYTIRGYAVILSISSFYFILSAYFLRFVKSRHEDHDIPK